MFTLYYVVFSCRHSKLAGIAEADPDLLTEEGWGSSTALDNGGGVCVCVGGYSQKIFFRLFGTQFALTLRGGAWGARAPLLDPPLYSMNTYPIWDSPL